MNKSRRTFISILGTGVLAVPVITLTSQGNALAAARLDPEDPAAISLNYVHISQDTSRICSSCQFYTGTIESDWGACVIFPDKQVSAKGSCNSWYAKA